MPPYTEMQPERNMLPIPATVRAPGAGLSPQRAATMTARREPCLSERSAAEWAKDAVIGAYG